MRFLLRRNDNTCKGNYFLFSAVSVRDCNGKPDLVACEDFVENRMLCNKETPK